MHRLTKGHWLIITLLIFLNVVVCGCLLLILTGKVYLG